MENPQQELDEVRHLIEAWIETRGFSRCPLCTMEKVWSLEGLELMTILTTSAANKIASDPKIQPASPAGERVREDQQEAHEWSLRRIRQAMKGNAKNYQLAKLTCNNCAYTLLLDYVKIHKEFEAGSGGSEIDT